MNRFSSRTIWLWESTVTVQPAVPARYTLTVSSPFGTNEAQVQILPAAPAGQVQVLRMELLAVRPDLFGPEGLARGLRGFLRRESGAPRYRVEPGSFTVDVDPDPATRACVVGSICATCGCCVC